VHEASLAFDGTIRAEHGIGLMHVARVTSTKPALDLELMGRLKAALDSDSRLNPGKVLA
jgi:FAD/FMN-containing dehydrogenase